MTSLPLYESLSDEQAATLIAEKMGWTREGNSWLTKSQLTYDLFVWHEGDDEGYFTWHPSWFQNLHQCWLFEEWLLENTGKHESPAYLKAPVYRGNLEIYSRITYHATANERCKAFLITVGECR